MKITITFLANEHVVRFTSPYGECCGVWSSGSKPRKLSYQVELDVGQLENAADIQPAKETTPSLSTRGEQIYLRGQLEEYEPDGFLTLRVGEDMLCIESPYDARVEALKGQWVELVSDCLYLYDNTLL